MTHPQARARAILTAALRDLRAAGIPHDHAARALADVVGMLLPSAREAAARAWTPPPGWLSPAQAAALRDERDEAAGYAAHVDRLLIAERRAHAAVHDRWTAERRAHADLARSLIDAEGTTT
jgi:hypothetical protein